MSKINKENLDLEVNNIVDGLGVSGVDSETKEYTVRVNNAVKLQQMSNAIDEHELKVSRDIFDRKIREDQINLDIKKFEQDVKNKENDILERKLDRELDERKLEYQHQERMAEIEVNRIKAENEKKILEQNQIKSEREFKLNRLRDWLMFGGKALLFFGVVGLNVLMHKDEIRLEREDHGIVPSRCKGYDAVMNKAAEVVLK